MSEKQGSLPLQVAQSIMRRILAGELPPGSVLPSERELQETYRVSRPVVREALKHLSARGLIAVSPGHPAVVSPAMSTPLLDLLLILFARSNVYFDDLIATRLLLEPQTAALAAQHASATQRREVQSLARSFNDIVGDLGETVNTRQAELLTSRDSRLHYAIAEASNNPVLPILTEVLIGLSWRQSLSYKVFPSGDQFRTASHQHLAIANAIVQRDSAAAEKAMIEHLEFTRLTFKDVPEDLTQLTTNSLAS